MFVRIQARNCARTYSFYSKHLSNHKTQNGFMTSHRRNSSFFSSALEAQSNLFTSLSESKAVEYCQLYFESVHEITGLTWWSSIMVSTILARTMVTLPFSVYQSYIFAKLENLQSEMPAIVKELKMETAIAIKKFQWTEAQARTTYNRSLRKQWDNLIIRDNCHPFKGSILLLVQLPMWVCLSVSMRNMAFMLPQPDTAAELLYLQLSLGGALWFPNLVIPDASLVIPVLFGITNLAIIEMQSMTRVTTVETKFRKYVTYFFRGLSVIMVPIAATVPVCMSLYWTTSSLCGLCCNLLLLSPKVKRLVGIPKTVTEIEKPYSHLLQQIKIRLRLTPKS